MSTTICEAISAKKALRFYYDGGYRVVEPFCHGTSRANNEVLSAYQTEGYSESGNSEGWKLFKVEGISSMEMTDTSFSGDRPGYNPNDSRMINIHCHI